MKPVHVTVINGKPIPQEFDTEEQASAARNLSSPTDPVVIARYDGINKEQLLCANLLNDLRLEFKKQVEQGMTITEAADVFNRVQTTMLALRLGWLREARVLANNTATGGSFTAGRKTFLLNSIDVSIAQL